MASGTTLNPLGNFSYNGVAFSPCQVSAMAGKMVRDAANRMNKWVEWTLSVTAYVHDPEAGASSDQVMTELRRKLTEPGKALHFEDRGFGYLNVNVPGEKTRDVRWGPQPEILTWNPVGADQVALVEWKVVFRIPECETARFRNQLMSFCYECNFSIDSDGWLTYTMTGSIEIPVTFSPGGGLPDNADSYWESVFPPPRPGFQRMTNNRTLSMDRSTLSFTIVDQELPAPFPPGCTFARLEHEVNSQRARITINPTWWAHTVSGVFRTNPALQRVTAYVRFMTFLQARLLWIRNRNGGRPPNILLTNVHLHEDVLGKDSKMSVSFIVAGHSLATVVDASGLWTTTGNDWAGWQASLTSGPYSARGNSNATFNTQGDTIIDLCKSMSRRPSEIETRPIHTSPSSPGSNQAESLQSVSGPTSADYSWMSYQSDILYSEDNHVVRHTPLAGKVTESEPGATPSSGTNLWTKSDQSTISQRTVPPACTVRLVGQAWRIGNAIQPPILKQFQGRKVVQARCDLAHKNVSTLNGLALFGLAWDIEYHVERPPDSLPFMTPIGPGGPKPPENNLNLGTLPIQRPTTR